jgi:hypothetical protein
MPNYTNTNVRRFGQLAGIQMFSFFAGIEFERANYWSAGLYAVAAVFFCSILGDFLCQRSEPAAPAQDVTRIDMERKAASLSAPDRSSIRDDSRFLAFWVMAWMPLMCALFLVASTYLAGSGEMLVTGAYFIFVYVMFAPALCRLFIGGLRHRDRGS